MATYNINSESKNTTKFNINNKNITKTTNISKRNSYNVSQISTAINNNFVITQNKNNLPKKCYHPFLWTTSNLINTSMKLSFYLPYLSTNQIFNLTTEDSFYVE